MQNSLVESDGASRVKVSSGRDVISVITREADINGIDTDAAPTDQVESPGHGGVEAEEVAAETAASTDSGTFLGAFGLIQSAWKDLLSDWVRTTVAAKAVERDPYPGRRRQRRYDG